MQPSTFTLALVTGASSGIGEALAELLAAKKIPLILTGRNREKLEFLQQKLLPLTSVEIVTADLGALSERVQLIQLLHERNPDLVINNAGFGLYGEAITYATEAQRLILEVNGAAVLDMTLESAKALIAAGKKGVILNVSSVAGFQIFPIAAVYAASKACVNSFSQALDYELKPKGVRVLTACPGQVATSFSERAGGKDRDRSLDSLVMTPQFAAEAIWQQIERQDSLVIFNWKYRLLNLFSSLLPTAWVAPFLYKTMLKRIKG